MTPGSNARHGSITHKLLAAFTKGARTSDIVDGNPVHEERVFKPISFGSDLDIVRRSVTSHRCWALVVCMTGSMLQRLGAGIFPFILTVKYFAVSLDAFDFGPH